MFKEKKLRKSYLTFWIVDDRNFDGKSFSSCRNPVLNEGRVLIGTKSKFKRKLKLFKKNEIEETFENVKQQLRTTNNLH